MRSTFSQLIKTTQDFCIDPGTSNSAGLSDSLTIIKRELNNAVKDIFTLMKKYKLRPLPKTATTVVGQIWYHNPPGLSKIESVTMAIGNIVLPLRVIHSQEEWDKLHIVPIVSNYPIAIFPRRDDFGIYPTPRSATTLTIVGNYQPLNMTADDYVGASAAVTNNSVTITPSGATLTADMVNRYFMATDDYRIPTSNWYRIATVTPSTSFTLETYYQDATDTDTKYLIAESPDIPEELHEFLPYRAASVYYGTRRRDLDQAQRYMNYYYTGDWGNQNRSGNIRGGILAVLKDLAENGSGNSQITEMTGTAVRPVLIGGIWSTVVSST